VSLQPAPGIAGRAHRATESLHSLVYFCPEAEQTYVALGLRPGRMGYFASRAAPMGAASAGVVTATFYNFNPEIVARVIPRAWTLASPADIVVARFTVADLALRRLLGDALDSPEVAEAGELARAAATGLAPEARPLFAGHAELAWPDEPHLVLWHAATLLREYRGDGHLMALHTAGLSGIESIVTHTATGRGFLEPMAKLLRGWSDDQWGAAVDGLRVRGLMDAEGLTTEGVALREDIEAETDRLDAAPWQRLGPERTQRLIELGKGLTRVVVGNGAFPADVFAIRR
jgi:helix-turn-helix protein